MSMAVPNDNEAGLQASTVEATHTDRRCTVPKLRYSSCTHISFGCLLKISLTY